MKDEKRYFLQLFKTGVNIFLLFNEHRTRVLDFTDVGNKINFKIKVEKC